ncbi:Putative NADH-flavin reductase [Tangfeifania diversioriginum]|uniref:Putative NADH-flavin reductase n=1 Tax=Tangfeifania diversioriginum TaxID=1168035 RepID=A0A1M6GBN6_9BACT|nr:NAD(P)-binding oxidoreductase [Tangfeifania diversioriginum]SHJ07363.1 Putative NADH-flavin reductase [Tangfeifania diversioriginum]
MQILIFGATGSLGSHIVEQALEKDYSVKAFTRNPEKLRGLNNSHLTTIQGDVNNLSEVENAMKDVDAVFCALGDGAKGKVRAAGTRNIIKAMKKSGVKRLICQTTLGLGDSWNNLNFFWKYIMFGFLLKKAFQDHQLQEKYILESGLNYTIVRPGAFTNGEVTQSFQIDFDAHAKNLALKISRADIAFFMLEQLASEKFVGRVVSISN